MIRVASILMIIVPIIDDSEIAFSKAFILGIINVEDWGLNPNAIRNLQRFHGDIYTYNYWDYIEAWKKAFFYQNSFNTHTWFFRFEALKEPSINLKDFPHWFFQWFSLIGPEKDIFPPELLDAFSNYSLHHPKHQKPSDNLFNNIILLRFLGHYEISFNSLVCGLVINLNIISLSWYLVVIPSVVTENGSIRFRKGVPRIILWERFFIIIKVLCIQIPSLQI